jgi:hypothetical protein
MHVASAFTYRVAAGPVNMGTETASARYGPRAVGSAHWEMAQLLRRPACWNLEGVGFAVTQVVDAVFQTGGANFFLEV